MSKNVFSKKIVDFLLFSVLIFNVIDIFVTVRFIKHGKHDENNPFMKLFLDMDGVMPFITLKSSLICLGLYLLYKKKDKILAQIGAYFCFCFYWALICQFYFFLWVK